VDRYRGNVRYGNRALEGYGTGADLVPVDVRRKLGIGPGSVLEWQEDGDRIVVRRAGRFSSGDIYQALFGAGKLATKSVDELKDGIRHYARKRCARA
jgi:bifunctional DNA-binding transcriptional regulator/antitoxin component of YhaV-PrlF toxin-antitoxin module